MWIKIFENPASFNKFVNCKVVWQRPKYVQAIQSGGLLSKNKAPGFKALEIEERQKAIKEYGSTDSGASLGDILGAALDGVKTSK